MEWSVTSWSTFKLLLVTLIVICLLKALILLYRQQFHWKNHRIPHVPAMPILGSGWGLFFRRLSFAEYSDFLYKSFPGSSYIGMMDFATPGVVLRDPELIKDITVKSFDNFPDHRNFINEDIDPIFGKNVFSLRGDRWKEMRNTLSPSFTASKMKFMFELVSKCSTEFVQYLADHSDQFKTVETKDLFTRYTTDVIATAAFGISVNSLKDRKNEFFVRGADASSFGGFRRLLKFILFRLSPSLAKLLGLTFLSTEAMEFFQRVVSETIATREKEGIVRPDMIHLLMQARDKSGTHQMTIDDIIAQAFIFFLAGFDTSSTLMCYMTHELAVCQDVQDRLREEVDRHFKEGNGEITYEALAKMEYMDMVVSETLRKYPPVVLLDRTCVASHQLPSSGSGQGSYKLQPTDVVWLPAYSIHHDPKYFSDPEKFDPERFNEENKDNIQPYTYMPFGLGPRKCIGNRFALMETKLLMAHLLHKFVLKRTEKTRHPVVYSKTVFTLHAEGGFWLGLEKRKH